MSEPVPWTRRDRWLAVGLCGLGILAAYWPTWSSGFRRMQAERGDSLHLNYVLEHQYRQLARSGAVGSYWSPGYFHPTPNGLAYSENLLGTLPFYVLPRVFSDPATAFQLWGMLLLACDFIAMLWALRRLEVRPWLAAVGAFVFAFALVRIGHLNHQLLVPQFAAPVALAAATAWIAAPRLGLWVTLWAALTLQLFLGLHLGWFLFLSLGVWLLVAVILDPRAVVRCSGWLRRAWFPALATVLASAALVTLLALPYAAANRAHGARDDGQVTIFAPRPYSWLAAPAGSLPSALGLRSNERRPFFWEHELFPGAVPLLGLGAALAAAIRGRRGAATSFAVAALVLFALTLYVPAADLPADGPLRERGTTLWWLVWDHVPGASAIRAVGRIWTGILPLLVMAVALTAERWRRTHPRRRALAVLATLATLALAEQIRFRRQPSFDKRAFAEQVARWREAIPAGCQVVYFAIPPTGPSWVHQMTAQWAALEAGVPTVNGYSSNYPPGYPSVLKAASRDEVVRWLGPVEAARLCYVAPGDS